MTATYEAIATTTLSTTASSVTFSSISGSYTDLVLVANANHTAIAYLILEFNSDSGSNYSCTVLSGNGTTASSNRYSNTAYLSLSSTTDRYALILNVPNYSNTTTYKPYISRYSNAGTEATAFVGTWRSTAAITSVTIKTSASTFVSGSTFNLYGIKSEA